MSPVYDCFKFSDAKLIQVDKHVCITSTISLLCRANFKLFCSFIIVMPIYYENTTKEKTPMR